MKGFGRMSLAVLATAGCMLAATTARGDLTLTGRGTATSLGMPSVGQETVYLKKTQLRRDVIQFGKSFSFLYDTDARQITVMDHSLRQAEVYAMKTLAGDTQVGISDKDMKLDLSPTGRTQALQGWKCVEHSLNFSMPAMLGTDPIVMQLAGTVWLAPKAKEQEEVEQFLKAIESSDVFLGIPLMAKAAPAQAAALSRMIRRVAPKGMPCAADLEVRYEGNGRMVELARRFAMRLSVRYEGYSTEPIQNEAFVVPPYYRVVAK